MKNNLSKALIALVLISAGAELQAWRYEFANHTNKTIAISLTYKGIGESRRVRVIKPGGQAEFEPGDQDITKGKAGFVPAALAYIENPPSDLIGTDLFFAKDRLAATTVANRKAWRTFNITWLPTESYELAIGLADQLGAATEKAAKLAMEAGAAYATGGASGAAEGAAALAKQASAKAKAESLTKAAGADFGLGKLITSIGKVAARDFVGNHHFDIVEDEKGKLSFIAHL